MVFTEQERKQRKRESERLYRLNNKEHIRELKRQSRERCKEQIRQHKHDYYMKNKVEWQRKRRERVYQLKTGIIEYYSKGRMCCANCGLRDLKNLTVDHINGNGENHRRSMRLSGGHSFYLWLRNQGYPEGFQILCFGCNMAKGGRIY